MGANTSGGAAAETRDEGQSISAEELTRAVLTLGTEGEGDVEEREEVIDVADPAPDAQSGEEEEIDGEETDEETDETETDDDEETEGEGEESDTDEEEEEADEQAETKDWSKRAQKRFNELTARAKSAEERAQDLEAKLREREEEQETAPVARRAPGRSSSPLADITDERALAELEASSRNLRRQLQLNPDGWEYTDPDTGEIQDVTPERVREALVQVTDSLEFSIPARRKYLAEERELSKHAAEFFPDLKDTGSEFRQKADAVVNALPEVRNLPGWRFAAGYYATGQMLAEAVGPKVTEVLLAIREGKSVDAILSKTKAKSAPEKRRAPRAPRAPAGSAGHRVSADKAATRGKRLIDAVKAGDEEAELAALEALL